jgi:hypothetical protein
LRDRSIGTRIRIPGSLYDHEALYAEPASDFDGDGHNDAVLVRSFDADANGDGSFYPQSRSAVIFGPLAEPSLDLAQLGARGVAIR